MIGMLGLLIRESVNIYGGGGGGGVETASYTTGGGGALKGELTKRFTRILLKMIKLAENICHGTLNLAHETTQRRD